MAEGHYPDELAYHADHGWAKLDGNEATIGISWFAQDALGEIVFFDPPQLNTEITAGRSYGEVESLKAVSELIAPLSGTVIEVNGELAADSEQINADPYGDGWLIKIELSSLDQLEFLLGAGDYEATLA